jgi:FkbM family methyltransferase
MSEVLSKIIQRVRYPQAPDIVSAIFGPSHDAVMKGALPVVLFCAGKTGRILCSFLMRNGINPVCFCDNDRLRIGQNIYGVPIISFSELQRNHSNSLILITSTAYQNSIRQQLLSNGFGSDRIFTLTSNSASFEQHMRYESVFMLALNGEPESVLDDLRKDDHKLLEAYNLFTDEKSKELFIRRLALIASGCEYNVYRDFLLHFSEPILQFGYDSETRFNIGRSHFYFTNDIFHLQDNEVLVDGGAYMGDSVDAFILACTTNKVKHKRVYCFEPDRGNYEKLCTHTAKYENVVCINSGLWSSDTTLHFVSSAQMESSSARIEHNVNISDMEIIVCALDTQLPGEKISLIKMDIEGAEIEAIKGAANVIKENKPKMAVAAYHRIDDLYEIPLLLHSIYPNYNLYLRHIGNEIYNTTLFAT